MKRISLWTVWKLRIRLLWMFGTKAIGWNRDGRNYLLKIRWNARFRTWVWCVVSESGPIDLNAAAFIRKTRIFQEFSLGPLQQWTLQEALSLAARKAEWVLHPDQEPVKEPEPPQTVPKHNRAYRMLEDGQFRVECVCGWIGGTRCHPETTAPGWCHKCGVAEESYDRHEQASQKQEAVAQ